MRTGDPDTIPRDGTLRVEEPPEFAEEFFGGLGQMVEREGPVQLLNYRVILHVDRVIDYTAPPQQLLSLLRK